MRYSQMSLEQRRQILDNPRNYPLRVTFLGKKGLLSREEIVFLQHHGVDFDVDDRQVAQILGEQVATPQPTQIEKRTEEKEAIRKARSGVMVGLFSLIITTLIGALLLILGIRLSRIRQSKG